MTICWTSCTVKHIQLFTHPLSFDRSQTVNTWSSWTDGCASSFPWQSWHQHASQGVIECLGKIWRFIILNSTSRSLSLQPATLSAWYGHWPPIWCPAGWQNHLLPRLINMQTSFMLVSQHELNWLSILAHLHLKLSQSMHSLYYSMTCAQLWCSFLWQKAVVKERKNVVSFSRNAFRHYSEQWKRKRQ